MGYKKVMTKRSLVVEDEADFSELLRFRLQLLNYEVIVAASGDEALDKIRRELPDVILLDLLLPDLDGLTICEILRQHPDTNDTPVFLMSAVTTDVIAQAARNAGAREFFPKPMDFNKLERHLAAALVPPSDATLMNYLPGSN